MPSCKLSWLALAECKHHPPECILGTAGQWEDQTTALHTILSSSLQLSTLQSNRNHWKNRWRGHISVEVIEQCNSSQIPWSRTLWCCCYSSSREMFPWVLQPQWRDESPTSAPYQMPWKQENTLCLTVRTERYKVRSHFDAPVCGNIPESW